MCACANERLRDSIIRVYMCVLSMHCAVFYARFRRGREGEAL